MIIKVYAEDNLIYHTGLEDALPMTELNVTAELNGSGSAMMSLPPENPYYNSFVCFKTIITIYKDDNIVFRGRPTYKECNFNNNILIYCEGERGFLNDSIVRPYILTGSPQQIFNTLIENHNSQVDPSKQFIVGNVTVTDLNDYVRFESIYAEHTIDVINKLIESCGGYITFNDNSDGERCINYVEKLTSINNQIIEFGENLLDLNITEDNPDIATRIIPYGSVIEGTDERIGIESVNSGVDYIQDDDAVSVRGVITKAVYFDDVSVPQTLLRKAQKYLEGCKNTITSIELSAIDLSYINKDYDSFMIGDKIHVRSLPHNIDDDFILLSKPEDLFHPNTSTICLNKQLYTLTSINSDNNSKRDSELKQLVTDIRVDYQKNMDDLKGKVFILDGASIILTSGEDLNNYNYPGIFGITYDSIAASLINCPSKYAGTLRVYSSTGRVNEEGQNYYLIQEYRSRRAQDPIYYRSITKNKSGNWSYDVWYESSSPVPVT
ncbi:MAG: phage tail spike protein [Acutalibacteraceae bacterium]